MNIIMKSDPDDLYIVVLIDGQIEYAENATPNFEFSVQVDGKLCLDDRSMLNGAAGHYLLYGSEWIVCIFDQHERGPLRSIGLPTFIEVKLPLEEISEWEKGELMQYMLMEWARFVAVRDRNTRIIDCSFTLKNNVPPEYITGHYHPSKVRCPFDRVVYKSPSTVCPSCS